MSGQIFLESAELSASETGGTVLVAIVRTGDLTDPVTITYGITADTAEAGVDFVDSSGTITMAAGQSRVLVPIEVLDDLLAESTESFILSLIGTDSGSLLAPRTARIDILDNESPITDPPQPGLISTHEFTETEVATGLDLPISAVFSQTNPDLVYIAEKGGIIKTLNLATGATGVFMDISDQVNSNSDRGILNIVLHPDFETNPYIYVYYVADPADGTGAAGADLPGNRYAYLSRFEADASTGYETVVPDSEVILVGGAGQSASDISGDGRLRFDIPENVDEPGSDYDALTGEAVQDYIKVDSTSHAGGGLAFGADGALYIGIGDGVAFNFVDPRAVSVQDINSFSGKVLRIDPITGEGLADNPFATSDLGENASKVYQLGLRNPFRLAFDDNGRILISDTGWNSYEELNSGGPGANFGWPFYEGGDGGIIIETEQYNDLPEAAAFYAAVADGSIVIAPSFRAFAHDSSAPGYQIQAITGGSQVFTGTDYSADFSNHYFFADFSGNEIYAVDVNDRRDVTFIGRTDGLRGPVDFIQGSDGKLYYIDIVSGRLVRIDDIIEVGGATVIATPAREILSGSAGEDVYVFAPGTSTTTFLDTINSWEPGDAIDLIAFNITEADLQVRLISGGEILKLVLGDGPDDFQLKVNLNGFTVDQVLQSILYDTDTPTGNRAPIARDDNLAVDIDTQGVIVATSNDFDPDGDAFIVQSFTQPGNGSVMLDEFGAFIFVPDDGYVGSDTFTYTIADPDGITATATVSITVSDPSSVNTITATTAFDLLTGTAAVDRFVFTVGTSTTESTDFIADWQLGDTIDLSALGLTPDDLELRLISGGQTLKLIEGFGATDFQVKINLNGFSEEDILASIDFGGTPAENRAPIANDDTANTLGTAPAIIDALFNDTDLDGDTLVISSFDSASGNGSVVQLSDGTLQYTANEGFVGVDTFTYIITDGELTSTATVIVDVSEDIVQENRAPVANDDTAETVATGPVIIDALTNDTDLDGDALTISAFDAATTNGSVVQLADGTLQYTANDGFVGVDSFTYTITDGELTSTATVSVDVSEDVSSVYNRIEATTSKDILVGTAALDQFVFELGESTGPVIDTIDDWQPGDVIDISGLGLAPGDLEARVVGGGSTLKLIEGFGANDFQVRIAVNGNSVADILASVDYGSGDVNRAPTAVNDTAITAEETTVSVNVLANDSDVDGDILEIVDFTQPAGGTVFYAGDGVFNYTPLAGTVGIDSFTYVISDGQGNESSAGVNVTVGDLPSNIVTATIDAEILRGGVGPDTYAFGIGTSVNGSVDTIVDWEFGDSIDLSALGLSLSDFDVRTVSGGTVLKLNEGFEAGDFQLRVNLNGNSVADVLESIIFDDDPNPAQFSSSPSVSQAQMPEVAFDFGGLQSDVSSPLLHQAGVFFANGLAGISDLEPGLLSLAELERAQEPFAEIIDQSFDFTLERVPIDDFDFI